MSRKHIDPRALIWICQPKLFIQSSDKVVLETEPFTELKPSGNGAEAIELSLPTHGSFCFSVKVDYQFRSAFDQCGIIIYENENRKAVIGTECRDQFTENLCHHQCWFLDQVKENLVMPYVQCIIASGIAVAASESNIALPVRSIQTFVNSGLNRTKIRRSAWVSMHAVQPIPGLIAHSQEWF